MALLTAVLKSIKARKTLVLLLFLVVLPIWIIFTAWYIDSWHFEQSTSDGNKPLTPEEREQLEHLEYNLRNVKCPAQKGRQLLDYWGCLWRTSITVEGMEQHRRILAENMRYDSPRSSGTENWKPKRQKMESSKESKKRRVKRQGPGTLPPDLPWVAVKMQALLFDTIPIIFNEKAKRICQRDIFPGSSIYWFWECIRSFSGNALTTLPTFQTTPYPQFKTEYHPSELKLLQLKDTLSEDPNAYYNWSMSFIRLGNEENLKTEHKELRQHFRGADPYIDDDVSPFRYRFNNLLSNQRGPAWSYRGPNEAARWHDLETKKFYLPLKKSAKLEGIEYLADLAQAYPGVGEVAAASKKLQTPIDFRWNKDSGYSAYTRFLLPLLTGDDLNYFKSKGLIDPSVTIKPDAVVIQDIVDGLENFQTQASEPIAYPIRFPTQALFPNFKYLSDEEIPFVEAYKEFITHFFGIDITKYKAWTNSNGQMALWIEYEVVRSLLQAYVEAVKTQEACVREMVDEFEYRRANNKDKEKEVTEEMEQLFQKAYNARDRGCNVNKMNESLVFTQYEVTKWDILDLYDSYFDRKDSRRRYSLPISPIEYKPCRQTDQSPVNILTTHGRKSSLKDYTFGEAAYRLNRFFMFYPVDSSPLLTVGIVEGERYDVSSVMLSGGAVKGHNLTFQYMHLHFGNKWNDIGSEHMIDGKGAPMELQMVFTIAGSADPIKYWHVLARVQNQLFQFRGKLVIILSVLVDVLETDEAVEKKIIDEKLGQDPYLFEPLAQAAYNYRRLPERNHTYEQPRGYVSTDPVFRFIDFVPRKSSNFYTYRGSLSWPPCFGYVVWSVYQQRLYMSKRQFDQFVKIPAYGLHNNFAHSNYRKADDIYVERENDPLLSYAAIQQLKKQRTIDRYVLAGYHSVGDDGTEVETDGGLVGEEVYYSNEDANGCGGLGGSVLATYSTCILSLYLLWMKIWQTLLYYYV